MTIVKRVTDMITTTKRAYSASHHLTLCVCVSSLSDHKSFRRTILELELELIQSQMAQKPMLRGEVGARAPPLWSRGEPAAEGQ